MGDCADLQARTVWEYIVTRLGQPDEQPPLRIAVLNKKRPR